MECASGELRDHDRPAPGPDCPHAGKFCVCVEVSVTYDWSGRKMRRMRAAKLTIISLVAAFVLTAPIFAHY